MATQTVTNSANLRSPCTVCGGHQWSFVRSGCDLYQPGDQTAFRLEQCLSCGQIMQNPLPTAEQLGRAYSSNYAPYSSAWKEPGWPVWKIFREWTTWRRMRRLHRYGRGKRLLEVGCGGGDFLYATHRAGWDVSAVEYSGDLVEALRSELGFDVRTGDLTPGLWEAGSFDVVIMWSVLEHLSNPLEALITVSNYLRPGGSLFIQIPTLYGVEQGMKFGQYWALLDLPRHLSFFGRECLGDLCQRAGLQLTLFKTPLLETAWCYFASVSSYARHAGKSGRMAAAISLAIYSMLCFPSMMWRAWRGQGTEAFAVAVKR